LERRRQLRHLRYLAATQLLADMTSAEIWTDIRSRLVLAPASSWPPLRRDRSSAARR